MANEALHSNISEIINSVYLKVKKKPPICSCNAKYNQQRFDNNL
jgi:hypothetical protein